MAEKKEKPYVSDNTQLMTEWNWKKNIELGFDPYKVTCGSGKKAWWRCDKGHEWQATIASRSSGCRCPYCVGVHVSKGENDLQTINPILAKEWNFEKNNGLTPSDVMPNSDKKVWWKCNNGHEWQASIRSRNIGSGCPYCANQRVMTGYNDLQTVNPILAKEWNNDRNDKLTPLDVLPNSHKKVWWRCDKGHEWQATIAHRNNGRGCPYCSNKKVLRGENDLQTINPILVKEWNYGKNGFIKPDDFATNSNKKIWWRCNKGHEWQATIAHRSNGQGCPICNTERKTSFPEYALVYYLKKYGLEVIHTYNEKGYELDVYIPSKGVAIEYDGHFWHKNSTKKDLEKNIKCKKDGIKLYRIREGLLPLNDSSYDFIVQRYQENLPIILQSVLSEIVGTSIEVDLNRDRIEIENLREYIEKNNSLLFSNPDLSKEWNYEKNGNLKPEHILAHSNKKVWWKCDKGHEWQSAINHRSRGQGCPYCANQKVWTGYNDLQTVNPILAKEWNYERNGELTPVNVMPNSGKKAWWRCHQGHEWQARIADRNKGRGCPYCSGRYAIKGQNDLQTVNPKLVKEWNYKKNGNFKPEEFTANSSKKVWRRCKKGHEWQASISNRTKGTGCPYCAREN